MSIFNELHPKLFEISKNSAKAFNDELQAALECLDKFEEEYLNGRRSAKERTQKDKTLMTTLQSIHEDDDEPNKTPETANSDNAPSKNDNDASEAPGKSAVPKKRSKDEVEGMSSPEQEKRQKRNASVKAQSIISKQVNVNLTQKLRRENSTDKRDRGRKDDDKENSEPVPAVQIKQEKPSLPPEPMDLESLSLDIEVKQEGNRDEFKMPPPVAPVPKSRKGAQKEKEKEKEVNNEEEESGRSRRSTRTRKQTDTAPAAPAPVSARSTRASSRASSRATRNLDAEDMPPPAARPKRTRTKKEDSEPPATEAEEITIPDRPKRTRRGKNADKEEPAKPEEPTKPVEPEVISPKEKRISQPENTNSPVLQKPKKGNRKQQNNSAKQQDDNEKQQNNSAKQQDNNEKQQENSDTNVARNKLAKQQTSKETQVSQDKVDVVDDSKAVNQMNVTVTLNGKLDKTLVLTKKDSIQASNVPEPCGNANETVVLESRNRDTVVLETRPVNDTTVLIHKDSKPANLTDDNSLLTEDSSEHDATPPRPIPDVQPTSAVKEKVQQFEELAARTTRTKTRAMAKLDEPDNQTPPDKMIKPVLSQETLNKMNNMIFNGKPPQISSSASKAKAHLPPPSRTMSASTSKLNSLAKHKEAAENSLKKEKEDARKKKEAMLEAKRELQRKKREEKMANAAAAREAAERSRKLAAEAAIRERQEKQIHADHGKMERLREVERKKQELARKVAETEERRRAEEQARQQKLADEQRRAELLKKKQQQEADAIRAERKEAALVEKEIEKRQRLKQNEKSCIPLKGPGTPGFYRNQIEPMEPVYMADGFQYLNSDEDEEPPARPIPAWSTSKARRLALSVQAEVPDALVDRLFSVRVHSPDLRQLFPAIERARLKRTSSAVWRTPPPRPPPPLAPVTQSP